LGGGQEGGLRAGTENIPGVRGFGVAAAALSRGQAEHAAHMTRLKRLLLQGIAGAGAEFYCITDVENAAPHILTVAFLGVQAEVLLHHLSREGIFVSSGSACSSRHRDRNGSPVLNAMKLERRCIEGAIRFSFSPFSTEAEVTRTAAALAALVPGLARRRGGEKRTKGEMG
jgi:cysteine desulfurase